MIGSASALVLITTLIVYLVTTYARNYFLLPASFRGPLLARVSGIWLVYQSMTCNLQASCNRLLEQHGPVVRISPRVLVTNDPEILRHISLPKSRWSRGGWYDAFELGGSTRNVFAERDEKKHKDLRAKLGTAYSGKGVDNLEKCIDERTHDLIRLLREQYARPEKVLDMTRISAYYALDVLSTVAFGAPFGFLEANSDKWNYISGNEVFIPIIDVISHSGTIRALFQHPIVQRLLAPKEADQEGFGRVKKFASDAIAARFGTGEVNTDLKRNDMLAAFRSRGLTLDECKSESLIQILAGTDSTTITIRNTLLRVVTNPRVYTRLQQEIDETVAAGKVAEGSIISDAEARRLPYLQAVIWEGLRKTPPLLGFSNKMAPPEGEQIGDVFFPGGCEVAICVDSVTHREDVFGPDVQLFRPERWTEADDDTLNKYQRVVELVFGSGRYGCLGRNIAWMELGKVFFELLRHFDWQIVDPLNPVKEQRVSANWLQKGMDMVVTERKAMGDEQSH